MTSAMTSAKKQLRQQGAAHATGSRRLGVDGWVNPCGHIDSYAECRREAKESEVAA